VLEQVGEVVGDRAHKCWSFTASPSASEVSVMSCMEVWWNKGSGRSFWRGDKVAKVIINASHCVSTNIALADWMLASMAVFHVLTQF
jgi:hypothetical protein